MAVLPLQIEACGEVLANNELDTDLENNEEVSTSITQTWTDQAIKCFVTKSDCTNCVIPRGNYSFTCQMNKVVPVLVKTLGAPDNRRIEKLMPYLYA